MLTPEQEMLKHAVDTYLGNPNPATAAEFKRAANPATILAILAQLESYIAEYEKVANRLDQLEAVQASTDKLLSIIACAYQIAGWHDAPEHILDVLSDPEAATMDQVEAMLPYQPGPVQAAPDDSEILLAAMRRAVLPLAHAANGYTFYRSGYFDLDAAIAAAVARRSGAPGEPGQ